jgi:hypothetical protein
MRVKLHIGVENRVLVLLGILSVWVEYIKIISEIQNRVCRNKSCICFTLNLTQNNHLRSFAQNIFFISLC